MSHQRYVRLTSWAILYSSAPRQTKRFPGVDIDAIHYKRGAVLAPSKPRGNDGKNRSG